MVLPRDERALLSVGTDRLGSEELVERQRGGDPLSVGPGAKQRSGGLSRSRGEQQGHLPRFTEVVLVRLDVVVRQAERERRGRGGATPQRERTPPDTPHRQTTHH